MLTSDEFLIFCITVREKDVLHVVSLVYLKTVEVR